MALKSLSDLKADERNADIRKISAEAKNGLASSLEEFGDLGAVIWNRRLGKLVGGHQRVSALTTRYGNLDIVVDAAGKHWIKIPTGESIAIRVVDWAEDRHIAAAVTANNPELQGVFTDKTAEILEEIERESEELYDALRMDVLKSRVPPPIEHSDKIRQITNNDAPEMAWVLVGCPMAKFGDIAAIVEMIAAVPGVFCETTVNNHELPE